ncbi:MAG: hypothetical protein WC248_07285 [Candidatus Methanomethylophilaceae archaeon]|jgi:hypothetical protein
MNDYEQRIVVYADVLGWSDACRDLSKFPSLQKAANEIANYAHNFSLPIKQALRSAQGVSPKTTEQHALIQFSFFSDNFVVSAPVDHDHVKMIFKIIAFATHELLRSKFLIRGAVALGGLYHDDAGVIFGPALVEAVDMEKKTGYPRLICSDCLIEFLERTDYKDNVIIYDLDKKWVANIACGSFHAMTDLNKIIDEKLVMLNKHKDKWQYMQEMLSRMYKASGISQ